MRHLSNFRGFRYSTQAKMVDTGTGTLYIVGSFKRMTTDPDFKVYAIPTPRVTCFRWLARNDHRRSDFPYERKKTRARY